jgi:hypothetical protein
MANKFLHIPIVLCALGSFFMNDFAIAAMLHCDCSQTKQVSHGQEKMSCHEATQSEESETFIGQDRDTDSDEKNNVECEKCVRHCQLSGQASIVSEEHSLEYFSRILLRSVELNSPQSIFPRGIEYPPKKVL